MNFNQMLGDGCMCQNTQMGCPTYTNCPSVIQTYQVQEIPHYINYHTHQINNNIKKHINIPVYSKSYEDVFTDQYVNGNPIYQAPYYSQTPYYSQVPYYTQAPLYQQQYQQYPNINQQFPNINDMPDVSSYMNQNQINNF